MGLEAKDQDTIDKEYAQAIEESMEIAVKRSFNVAVYPSFIFNRTAKGKREQELIARIKNILNSVSMYNLLLISILDISFYFNQQQPILYSQ